MSIKTLWFNTGPINLFALMITLFGFLLLYWGIRRLWRHRVITGSLETLSGLVFLMVATILIAISINLQTYHRLTHESPVAEIYFKAQNHQHFWVYMTYQGSRAMGFDMFGDEWQLDARILKWRGIALIMGFKTVYRLDRISGRYTNIDQERKEVRSVYALGENPGINLWDLARKHSRWIPWMDASYGSATYLPMVDGARYQVSVSTSGLLARPSNNIASEAVRKWR